MTPYPVVVVGAGWSGLAAATRLAEAGIDTTVLEAAAVPGGRARSLDIDGERLDNGQHLLLGAYRDTFAAMRRVGLVPSTVLDRRRLDLTLHAGSNHFRLRLSAGPPCLALPLGLLRARGLTLIDRLRALRTAGRLRRPPASDQTVSAWLQDIGQPPALVRWLWQPLCLAALNTHPDEASARVFARTLGETFRTAGDADLVLPRCDLGNAWPEPAVRWLRERNVPVHLSTRVHGLTRADHGWLLHTRARILPAAAVILAIPPTATARLVATAGDGAQTLVRNLHRLESRSIITVWLRVLEAAERRAGERPGMAEATLAGHVDGPAQWIFDRRLTGQPDILAAVISDAGSCLAESRDHLGRRVARQLASAAGRLEVLATIREKRATFAATPTAEALRPAARGPWPGLWLAGDHVANGLPATIEGAVRNGHHAAEHVIAQSEMSA